MSETTANKLKDSINEFDLVELPAIDFDNTIVAGHMRLYTLQGLGRADEEIEVRVPNRKLTENEFTRYNLISNKVSGEWDLGLLTSFDPAMLEEVGFTANDLQLNVDKYDTPEEPEAEISKKTGDSIECPECHHVFVRT